MGDQPMPPKLYLAFARAVSRCHAKLWLALLTGWRCMARFAGLACFSPSPISIKLCVFTKLSAGCA